MKAMLKLEVIGDNTRQKIRLWESVLNEAAPGLGSAVVGKVPPPCWVAELTGLDERYGFASKFLPGKKDYSAANSTGSRGVFLWYILESGRYYEVKEQISWRKSERYFVKVSESGDIIRVDKEEVTQWLKDSSV